MTERDWYAPFPYEQSMRLAEARFDNEAWAIDKFGRGSLLNVIRGKADTTEGDMLIGKFAEKVGFSPDAIEYFDIGGLIAAFETSINIDRFGIPEKTLRSQTVAQNIYQYVYRGFGREDGWRIGIASAVESLKRSSRRLEVMKEMGSTPFGDFIRGMEFDLEPQPSPRILVLEYPAIEDLVEVADFDDLDWSDLTPGVRDRIAAIFNVFSAINSASPTRFREDNPDGHTLINVIDPLYKWFMLRERAYLRDYEQLASAIFLPSAHERDMQLMRR